MDLKLNDKQVVILKGLLDSEIEYLEKEAIPDETNDADVKGLKEELANCKELLNQLKQCTIPGIEIFLGFFYARTKNNFSSGKEINIWYCLFGENKFNIKLEMTYE